MEDKKKIEDYLKSDVLDSSVLEKYGLDPNEENKKKALEIQKEVYRELLDKLRPEEILGVKIKTKEELEKMTLEKLLAEKNRVSLISEKLYAKMKEDTFKLLRDQVKTGKTIIGKGFNLEDLLKDKDFVNMSIASESDFGNIKGVDEYRKLLKYYNHIEEELKTPERGKKQKREKIPNLDVERKKAPNTLNELFDKLEEDGEKLREILARFKKNLKIDNERFAEIATSDDVKRIEKKIEDSEPLTREEIGIMVKIERTKQTVLGDRINASTAESTAFYLASGDKDIKGMLELRVLASESILRQYEEYFASRKKEEDFKWKENPEGAKAAKKLSKATGEKTKGFWGKIGEKLDVWTEAKIIPHEEWIEFDKKLDGIKDENGLREAIGFLREKTKDKKIPERFPEKVKDVLEKTLAIINSTDREEGIQWYLSAIEDGDIKNNNNFTTALKKDRELIGKAPRGACKNSLNKMLDKIEEIWKSKIGTDQKLDELEKITKEISETGEAASKPEGKPRERQTAGTTTLYDWAMDKYRGARKTIAENSVARATGISKAIYKGDYESFKKKRVTVEEEKKAYRQAKTPKARYDEILDGAWKGKSETELAAIMEVMIEKKELTIDEMSKHLSSEEIRSLEKSISEALMRRGFAFDIGELKKSMPQLASQVELKPENSQDEVDKKTMEYTKEIVSKGELASLNRAAMEDPIVINIIRKEHNDFDLWVKGRSETDKQSIKRGLEGMLLVLDGKIRAAGKGDITNITGSEDEKIVSVAGVEMTKNELQEEISSIRKSLVNSDKKDGYIMLNEPAMDSSGEIVLNKEGRIDFENGTINEKARKEFAESMKSGKDTYRNRTSEFYEAMGRYFSKEQFNQVKKHCSSEQMKAAKKSALMAPAGSVSQEILDFLETDLDYKFLKIEGDVKVEEKTEPEKEASQTEIESTKKQEKDISDIFDKDIEKIRKGSIEEILKEIKNRKEKLNKLGATDEKSGKKIRAYQIALDLIESNLSSEKKNYENNKNVITESIKRIGNKSAVGFFGAIFNRLTNLDAEEEKKTKEKTEIKKKIGHLDKDVGEMSKKQIGDLLEFLRYNLTHGHIDKKQKLPALTARFEKESRYKKYKDLLEKRETEIKNMTIEDLKNAVDVIYEEKQ